MYLTTTNIKLLSKSIRNTLTFSTVADLLNKVVNKDSFKEILQHAIGKKEKKTINQRKSDELVANILGSRNYNTLLTTTSEKESLKKHQIIDGIECLLKDLKNETKSASYDHFLKCINDNVDMFHHTFNSMIKDLILSLENETDDCYKIDKQLIDLIVTLSGKKVTSIFIDSYNDLSKCEIRMVLGFDGDNKLEIDAVLNICSATGKIDYIFDEKTTINDMSIENTDEIFGEFIELLLNGFTDCNIDLPTEKVFTEEEMKRLSLFVSDFTRVK